MKKLDPQKIKKIYTKHLGAILAEKLMQLKKGQKISFEKSLMLMEVKTKLK